MATPTDTAPRRTADPDLVANRKLIRPSLADIRGQLAAGKPIAAPAASSPQPGNYQPPKPGKTASAAAPATAPAATPRPPKKPVPPEQTNAESFYYLKQMQTKTPVVLVLQDGEKINGVIEWYDRGCLKIHRNGEPNLLIYKANIKYIYKVDEESEEPES